MTVPRLAMLFGKKRLKEYSSILSRLTNILVILTLPASVGLFMLAKEVILLISGAHFTRAIYSLRILCFAYVFALLAWILTDCILIPAKREKFVLISMSVSAILNILLNILLIPIFAENAAAFSTVIAEFSIFVINLYYTRDIIRKVFTINDFLKNLFSSIAGCIGIIVICLICDFSYKSLLLKSVCSVFLSAIIYFAILVLLRNNLIFSLIEKIR